MTGEECTQGTPEHDDATRRKPAGEKREARAAPVAPVAPAKPIDTFERIARLFIAQYAGPNTRTWAETERLFNKEVMPQWGERLFGDITRANVNELLRAIVDRGAPYTSNRTLAYLRKLFNWAIDEGYAEASPCERVKKKAPETKRDRVLSDDEIRVLWAAWEKQDWPFGQMQQLLLVTGQRREEVGGMRWEELNFDDRLWLIPRGRTKSDRAHLVPLSATAIGIITALPRFLGSPFVFPASGRAGRT